MQFSVSSVPQSSPESSPLNKDGHLLRIKYSVLSNLRSVLWSTGLTVVWGGNYHQTNPFRGGRLQFCWIVKLQSALLLSPPSTGFSRERTARNIQCCLWQLWHYPIRNTHSSHMTSWKVTATSQAEMIQQHEMYPVNLQHWGVICSGFSYSHIIIIVWLTEPWMDNTWTLPYDLIHFVLLIKIFCPMHQLFVWPEWVLVTGCHHSNEMVLDVASWSSYAKARWFDRRWTCQRALQSFITPTNCSVPPRNCLT